MICIRIYELFNKSKKKPVSLHTNLKASFDKIREELEDHLTSINENTSEITANNEYIMQLEMKISKLSERLDEIEMALAQLLGKQTLNKDLFKNISLTLREQEIFVVLYSRNGDLIDYKEIAKVLGLTEEMVVNHVNNLTLKGIPVIKRYMDNKVYLILDADFRNLQAKENVIKIKGKLSRDLQNRKVV
ncbi:hypothetical protein JW930_07545 [Candidatus Woesearchaeota archaeon]|nr:hypothetical protein [Candidatus Woesearchaeota archaeon]